MWRNALKTFVLCGWVSWLSCNAAAPDKSGVKPSAISLPSGAGSIEGLGESFEPQLNTGSSSYGVAIALPPGRAGLQPSVRLSYNSGLGNSIVGLGWSLEFPTIKRQTDKGFPTYTDNDVFVFQGEELVPLSNPEGDWRCENESAFQRFRQIDTDNDFIPDSWEMTERNGTRHIFGEFRGKSGRWSAVTHPFPPPGASTSFDRTYCWALNTTIDLHGNRIEYHYLRPNNDPESSGILYPSRITYSPLNGYFHDVRFRYEDRPDKFDDYRPTFSIGIGRRLIGIEVHSFYEGADHLVRAYDLEYAYRAGDGMDAPDGAIDLGVSTLKRIVQRDRSGNANNFLPPLVFAYSSMRLTEARLREIDPPELELAEPGGNVQIADVNGDSLPDIIKTGEGLTAEQIVCWNRGEFPSSRGAAKELQFSPFVVDKGGLFTFEGVTHELKTPTHAEHGGGEGQTNDGCADWETQGDEGNTNLVTRLISRILVIVLVFVEKAGPGRIELNHEFLARWGSGNGFVGWAGFFREKTDGAVHERIDSLQPITPFLIFFHRDRREVENDRSFDDDGSCFPRIDFEDGPAKLAAIFDPTRR
ncbi:MAG TPA: hypothetical protein DCE44_17700 [Verrucomicrobiales bacterium]|nr:hypothetical protein [Verrucomicrobiales bacterium]